MYQCCMQPPYTQHAWQAQSTSLRSLHQVPEAPQLRGRGRGARSKVNHHSGTCPSHCSVLIAKRCLTKELPNQNTTRPHPLYLGPVTYPYRVIGVHGYQ